MTPLACWVAMTILRRERKKAPFTYSSNRYPTEEICSSGQIFKDRHPGVRTAVNVQ
jgi:hypothetical protein